MNEQTQQTIFARAWDGAPSACHAKSIMLCLVLPNDPRIAYHTYVSEWKKKSSISRRSLLFRPFLWLTHSPLAIQRGVSKQFLPVKHLTATHWIYVIHTMPARFSPIKRKCIANFFDFSLNVTHILRFVVIIAVVVVGVAYVPFLEIFTQCTASAVIRSMLLLFSCRI